MFFREKSSQISPMMKSKMAKFSQSQDLLLVQSHIWRAIVLCYHVFLKTVRSLAGVVALATSVWLFPSMSAFVYFQMNDLSGRVVALITLEWLLS